MIRKPMNDSKLMDKSGMPNGLERPIYVEDGVHPTVKGREDIRSHPSSRPGAGRGVVSGPEVLFKHNRQASSHLTDSGQGDFLTSLFKVMSKEIGL